MNKILGIDSAYDAAIESRGRQMLLSANLVVELINRIRQLKPVENDPLSYAKSLALYLENNIGSKYSCLRDDLSDFIADNTKD